MQKVALFRKLIIDNKPYYQLYDIKENFEITEEFTNYENRSEKDYFYLSIKNDQVAAFKNSRYVVFADKEEGLSPINTDNELFKVFEEFKKHFKDMENLHLQQMSQEEVLYNEITKDVLFQDEVVIEILEIINRNLDILNSDIDDRSKLTIKDNILLYGLAGSGKNTLIDSLQKNLGIPYADIKLLPDFETNVAKIIRQLISTADGDIEKAQNGIIYVRDNFDKLANCNDTLAENPFIPLQKLMSGIKFSLGEDKREFNFEKLTFIIAFDVPSLEDKEDYIVDFEDMPNMHFILANQLTTSQQKEILYKSNNSILNIYKNILKKSGKSLSIQKGLLDDLILTAKSLNSGLNLVNAIISKMIKNEWYNGSSKVYLTKSKLQNVLKHLDEDIKVIDNYENNDKKTQPQTELEYNLESLVNDVKKNVCSQDEHVKRILYTVLRNRYAANNPKLDNPKRYIKNILIRGESGSGKTLIITEISKLLKLPIFIADATSYTEAGYVGNSVTDMLTSLYNAAGGDLAKAERGILVIDEIDKKSSNSSSSNSDGNATRGAVLDGLLKIIEGAVIPITVGKGKASKEIMFDTSRLTVICSGAFEDIESIRDQRIGANKKSVGFGGTNQPKPNQDPNIIDDDYINYGMNRQFMARLGVIVNLNKLKVKDLKHIMQNSQSSELIIQKNSYMYNDDVELVYEDEFCEELALKAYNKRDGARGIEKAFQEVLDNIHFMDVDTNTYSKIIFNKECISDPNKVVLVKREKAKILSKRMN